MKIAIVVHGRFHAFELTRSLLEQGHQVTLFTNYPKWAVHRFGISNERVKSFWFHGVVWRITSFFCQRFGLPFPEAWLHRTFSRWAVKELKKEPWEVVHAWSGISEEIFKAFKGQNSIKLLMRGSAHILVQAKILEEEEKRVGIRIDKPTPWMIDRELREYQESDYIRVSSCFAYRSFIDQGLPPEKLLLIPLGTSLESFRPSGDVVGERRDRILKREPLRILYVGGISFRKGMQDMREVIEHLPKDRFFFRLVGAVSPECKDLLQSMKERTFFLSKQPQAKLPEIYAWGDLFFFPTVEDGYAVVLSQAQAAGLPILTTANCSGPDFIEEGKTGWILPIRSPHAYAERLQWCDANRTQLAEMIGYIDEKFEIRNWQCVAKDFATACRDLCDQSPKR